MSSKHFLFYMDWLGINSSIIGKGHFADSNKTAHRVYTKSVFRQSSFFMERTYSIKECYGSGGKELSLNKKFLPKE